MNLRTKQFATFALVPVLALALALAAPTMAAGKKQKQVERTSGLSQQVYEKITVIQELAENDDTAEAERLLAELLDSKLSDYEKAQSWFLMGYIRYMKEDMSGALKAYKQVMNTEDIPLGMRLNVIKTLSQLYMITDDFPNALKYIDLLIDQELEPHAENYALKAQILYQLERMDPAMAALGRAIEINAEAGKPPRENWLLLKNAVFYNRNDYPGMLAVVRQLVDLYPRDRYLLNMAAVYGELGESDKQLGLMEPLYEKGALKSPSHRVNLASLYLLHDVPYKAALLLREEIGSESLDASERNLEMLAQAWLLAAKPAEAVEPQNRAASMAKDGRGYVSLARTLMSLERWKEAEHALQRALEKGGLRDTANTRLMQGMTQFNQKKFREARRSFARAGEAPKTEKLAGQWLAYLEREEAQQELARSVGIEY